MNGPLLRQALVPQYDRAPMTEQWVRGHLGDGASAPESGEHVARLLELPGVVVEQILSGSLGQTTAHFAGGQPFTLTPEDRTSGWRGGVRVAGGGAGITIAGEVNAEQQQGHASIGGRLGLQLAL